MYYSFAVYISYNEFFMIYVIIITNIFYIDLIYGAI